MDKYLAEFRCPKCYCVVKGKFKAVPDLVRIDEWKRQQTLKHNLKIKQVELMTEYEALCKSYNKTRLIRWGLSSPWHVDIGLYNIRIITKKHKTIKSHYYDEDVMRVDLTAPEPDFKYIICPVCGYYYEF